jgi:tryptophan-rich sensory protein
MPGNLVRGAVDSLANSRGRSAGHILWGLGLTAGALGLSVLAARLLAPKPDLPETYSDYQPALAPEAEPKRPELSAIWSPLFLALTLSGFRIWNAPKSAERTQALGLWGAVQALNAALLVAGPRKAALKVLAAGAALGAAGAYVWRARKVDPAAAGLVSPYVGWMGAAGALTDELRRPKLTPAPTLH